MLSAEENDRITRAGPGKPAGALLRRYWQPAALVDELDGQQADQAGQAARRRLCLFRDEAGRYGLLGRACPHRGTDLAYGRREDGGLRCAFHGWLFDVDGRCLRRRPSRRQHHVQNIRHKAYRVVERSGILSPISGPASRRHFRTSTALSRRTRTPSHSRGIFDCNWLQSLEVGIDPAHASFLHRFFQDEDPKQAMASSSATTRPIPICRSPG